MTKNQAALPPDDPLVEVDHPVAMLDEHYLEDNEGKPLVYLDESLLQRFCDNLNRKYAETGDPVPLIDGHTRDGKPAWEQPPILGYAYPPWKVSTLGNSGRKAIFSHKVKIYKSAVGTVRQRPRRSVEIWPKRWDIDPIALLGAETPDRYLGQIKLANDEFHYTHTMGDSGMDPSMVSQIANAVMAQLTQSAPFQFLTAMMEEHNAMMQQQAAAPPTPLAAPPQPPQGAPVQGGNPEPEGAPAQPGEGPPPPPNEEDEKVKKQAPAAPSGSNTFIPGEERVKLQREKDSLAIKLTNQEAVVKTALAERDQAIKKARDVRREMTLAQLEHEGYDLDRSEELAETDAFDDNRFDKHVERIRKKYPRDVTRIKMVPHDRTISLPSGRPVKKQATQKDMEKAIELCGDNPDRYDAMLAKVLAEAE